MTYSAARNDASRGSGFRVTANAGVAEVLIYSPIGEDGATTRAVSEAIANVRPTPSAITLRINSPGGFVDDGLGIYNVLAQHPARVTAYVDGLALSAASVIFMCGDDRVMADNAALMLHDPLMGTLGNERDHAKSIEVLQLTTRQIIRTYAARTGLSASRVESMMRDETWLDADEAVALGFAHRTVPGMKLAASFDLHGRGIELPERIAAKLGENAPMSEARRRELLTASGFRYRGESTEPRPGAMSEARRRELLKASGIHNLS